MTKLEAAAVKYAEKNHIWLKDAIPSLAAMKSFKDGAEWMHSETINKACEFLKSYRQETLVIEIVGMVAFIQNIQKNLYLMQHLKWFVGY